MGIHLCGQNVRIFRPGVAQGTQEPRFFEANGAKLSQESAAFLSSGNSGKPICFAGLGLSRQRFAQN